MLSAACFPAFGAIWRKANFDRQRAGPAPAYTGFTLRQADKVKENSSNCLELLGQFGRNRGDSGDRLSINPDVLYVMSAQLQNSSAPRFTGEFCHKVEGRNRITIPSDWRFGEEIDLFMIAKSLKKCISVMTQAEVDRLMAQAENLDPADRSDFRDMLGSSLRRVTLDKAGRISIPDEFFDQLGLPKAKEVWFTGSIDTFNIWSVTDFEEFKAQDKVRREELKRKLGI